MNLQLDPTFEPPRVLPAHTKTYTAFRSDILKPPDEDMHLRHIFRFYMARALYNRGEETIYILPHVLLGEHSFVVDVLAAGPEKFIAAICEPGSITPETEALLELLKEADNTETIILHSQFGNPGNVPERFREQLASKKFRLLAVVPPPFDDAYEYDIWMFELTFRDLFSGE